MRPDTRLRGADTSGAYRDYLPELQRARAQREKTLARAQEQAKADSMARVMSDLAIDREQNPAGALADRWDPDEEFADDDEDTEINIIDRCTYASRDICALPLIAPVVQRRRGAQASSSM